MTANATPCLICQEPLSLRLARGRKSGKLFLMLICPQDGRHFRGFINDQQYVASVLARLEGRTPSLDSSDGVDDIMPNNPSKINLEGQNG